MAHGVRARLRTAVVGERPLSLYLLAGGVAACVVAPLAWLALDAASAGLDRAVRLLTRPAALDVLLNSLLLVVAVTAASVALGVPLAVLTVRTDLPAPRFWTVVAALPLVVPSYIGAYSYVAAFGPSGVLANLTGVPLPALSGFAGTAFVLTLFTYPYVFLTTRAALLSFDTTLVEAARTLGESRPTAFRRVTLPRVAPAVTAGSLLVALYALSDFGTPTIMGYDVFTRAIYVSQRSLGGGALPALYSVQLVGVTAVVLWLESRLAGGDADAYASRGAGRDVAALGAWRYPALAFPAAVATLTLVLPLGVHVLWLARFTPGYAAQGLAFQLSYAVNSLKVSLAAALLAVLAALPVAYLAARERTRVARLLDRATYVGYAVPGVVVGATLVSFGLEAIPGLYGTLGLLVFAYVVRFLPQAVGSVRASVLQVDRGLTDAARTLGRTPLGAFRSVTLPLIAPGVAAGGALVFLTTMKELPVTLFLAPFGFDTFVTYIWSVQEAGYYGQTAVPALVLVALSALSMALVVRQGETDV